MSDAQSAERQGVISDFNAQTVRDQLLHAMQTYDYANAQNVAFTDAEKKQNSQQTEADRFNALRQLQGSAQGLTSAMGPRAMSGSGTYALNDLIRNQQDYDNVNYLNTLRQNQNTVNNSYWEQYNANQVAKMNAANDAEYAMRNLTAERSAAMQNIGDSYWETPDNSRYAQNVFAQSMSDTPAHTTKEELSGYTYPVGSPTSSPLDQANKVTQQPQTSTSSNSSYWNRLMSGYNTRAKSMNGA